jgi:arylsulfatase A-like enzyme
LALKTVFASHYAVEDTEETGLYKGIAMSLGGVASRRWFLQRAGAVLIASGVPIGTIRGQTASARPNVVFILADDLGYADLSCYGRRDFQTPNIDSLARDGLLLSDAYANSPVCSPTRFALLSGRYQYRFADGLHEPLGARGGGFPPEHPTIASQFRAAGYGTTLVGKWHLGLLPKHGPLKSGYDRFYGLYVSHADYFTHEETAPPTGISDLHEGEVPVDHAGYLTDLLADRAVEEIEGFARSGQPFFLSLHFNAPHWPWEGPNAEGRAASADMKGGGPTPLLHFDGGTAKVYADMMRNLDANVGRVLYTLDRHELRDNTIVVFTSDNGGERFSDNWPFSGMKTELLEGGIRVPTLVRWPARVRAGTRSEQQVMSMDWFPTLLAAAGVAPTNDTQLDGVNVLPALLGEQAAVPRKLFWRYKAQDQAAMRDGQWKYLKINAHEFLFDVVADPRERGNLKDRQREIFARLQREYRQWNAEMLPYAPEQQSHTLTGGGRIAERSF